MNVEVAGKCWIVPLARHTASERTIEALRLYQEGVLTLGVLQSSQLRKNLFDELAKLDEIDFGESS